MMINRKKCRSTALAAAALSLFLQGCGSVLPMGSEDKTSQGYSDAQTMIVIATERNRYRDVYTDQIWQVAVDDEGTQFQTYLLGEIKSFLSELKTMKLLADEREIRLSGQEKEQLQELAGDFYDSLTKEDLDYIRADKQDVYELYEDYHLANKLVDELTGQVDLEISDSEAKVITVQEISVSDEGQAAQIHEQAAAEGTDFLALARQTSESQQIERSVGRGEESKEYEDAVFSLEAGAVSPVIRQDGSYVIVKCINAYDEAATLARKEKLALARKNQAFRQIYDAFAAEHPVELQGGIWEKVSLASGENSTTTGFFEMYQEFMN